MKKIIFTTIVILFLGIILSNAQNVNVDLTVKFNGDYKTDSVYVVFYPTTEVELGQRHPTPYKTFVFTDLKKTLQIYPGAYTIGFLAHGYKVLKTRVYIPSNKTRFKMEINFNPQIIGWAYINTVNQIKDVSVRGEFNRLQKNGEIPLVKKEDKWVLENPPETLKLKERYLFFVNGENTPDLLNKEVVLDAPWVELKNIYQGNNLTFDPSLYSFEYKDSELILADSVQQNQFKQLVNELNILEKEKNEAFKKASLGEAAIPFYDSLITKYSIIEDKYPQDLSQLAIKNQLHLTMIKYMFLNIPQGNSNDLDSEDRKKQYFLGEEFEVGFTEINGLINKFDPNSYLLNRDFIPVVMGMQNLLNGYPELASRNNLSEKYYDEFIDHFIEKSPNKKLCYTILLQQAYMLKTKDEAKTIEILNELKSNPEYAEFINNDQIDRLLNEFNIKLGKIAPNFSVDLLSGEIISLDNYKGKFVFLDFWGSWCAPCRDEIPNIKKLYSSISRDKLEIIGLVELSTDTETKLRDYIQEQNIEYPNALASKELLAQYGISKFPTSFLINPKGKIVRIDVRGADAMKFIGEEIEDYFN